MANVKILAFSLPITSPFTKEAICLGNVKYAGLPLPVDEEKKATIEKQINGRTTWLVSSKHEEEEFKIVEKNFKEKAGKDYAASRGEYLNGIIMANYLGYEFFHKSIILSLRLYHIFRTLSIKG